VYSSAKDVNETRARYGRIKESTQINVFGFYYDTATMHFLPAICPHTDCVYCVLRPRISAGLQEAEEGPDLILAVVVHRAKPRSPKGLDSSVHVQGVCDPEVTH